MAYDAHNGEVLESLQVGDLVEFERSFYQHWAVYIGEWRLVEVSGGHELHLGEEGLRELLRGERRILRAEIKISKFWELTHGHKAMKNNKLDWKYQPKTPEDIRRDALAMVGQPVEYNILTNNCEHHANYWRYGQFVSPQADHFLTQVGAQDVVQVLSSAARTARSLARLVGLPTTEQAIERLRKRLRSKFPGLAEQMEKFP